MLDLILLPELLSWDVTSTQGAMNSAPIGCIWSNKKGQFGHIHFSPLGVLKRHVVS